MTRHRIRLGVRAMDARARVVFVAITLALAGLASYCGYAVVRLMLDFDSRETYTDVVTSSILIGLFISFGFSSARLCVTRVVTLWRSYR